MSAAAKQIAAAILSFLLLLAGIALCLFTDLYLKEQDNLPKTVDVHSWDVTGTILIAGGLMGLAFSLLALIFDDEDEKPSKTPFVDAAVKRAASSETIFKGR